MSNIDTSSWKEFKLGELFDIENTWIYGKNKQYKSQLKNQTSNSIAVVSGVTTNNGINYYTEDILDDSEIYNDCLTISTRGEYSGSVFYHDYPFVLANNILVMPMPELSKESKLFIATVIQALPFGGYGNYPTKDKLKESVIKLPVKESEEIDWDYMQEHIAKLEQEHIAELEQYLIATGLNDYELTDEDKKILATKLMDGGALQSSTSVNGWLKEARSFKLNELFEKIQTKKIYGKANDFPVCKSVEYTIPLLTAGADNQGFARYGKRNQCPNILKNVISISANGANTGVTFYQSDEFAVLQDAYAIKLKGMEIPNKQVGLFLAACINKILHGNFSWTFKAGWERIKEMSINLPIKQSGEIDWEYMEKYIKATEKVVIRDVVDWKDEMIKKTKEVVGGTYVKK